MQYPFTKMNGSGNDFIIFDGRQDKVSLSPEQIRLVASRDNAVTQGCDQVIVLENSQKADVFMRIFNANGGQVDACGNATRCVAGIIESELDRLPVSIETNVAVLHGVNKAYSPIDEEFILVDMGAPNFNWETIPLALPPAKAALELAELTTLENPAFVSMGNPHVVFFLRFTPDDASKGGEEALFDFDFESVGARIETHKKVFPEGVNVSIALLRAASDGQGHIIHARVWERGAGLTQACGTAACAMLAAAHARDNGISRAHIWFEPFGTSVTVQLSAEGHVLLGGQIEMEFQGKVDV